MKHLHYLVFISLLLVLHSCTEDSAEPFILNSTSDYKADVALDWFNLQRELVKSTPGFTPPVAARSFGYAGLALYECVVPGIQENVSYSGLITGYTGQGIPAIEKGKQYHWELAANACMAYMLRNQFKTTSSANLALIDQMEQSYKSKNSNVDTLIANRSVQFGLAVATAIYNFSKTDGKDEAYANNFPDYTIPDIPGKWEPTSAANPKPLQPYWGQVRPFLNQSVDDALISQFHPVPYSTDPKSIFYLQANEVYITSLNLSPEQIKIAKFWSDDPGATATPPGHSISIASQILKNENADLAFSAEVLSKVGLSVHDAFVSCWKCKYVYNLLRPVTYIKKFIDPNFTTILSTPPFPEHTSGHSVQTASAVSVLEHYFGYNYSFTDYTHVSRIDIDGSPRSFSSLAQLAKEAANSRLYGGIHYKEAIEGGIDQGRAVGRNIALIALKK